MTNTVLSIALVAGVAALGLAVYYTRAVLATSQGTERMVEIAAAIREGAMAFSRTSGDAYVLSSVDEETTLAAVAPIAGAFSAETGQPYACASSFCAPTDDGLLFCRMLCEGAAWFDAEGRPIYPGGDGATGNPGPGGATGDAPPGETPQDDDGCGLPQECGQRPTMPYIPGGDPSPIDPDNGGGTPGGGGGGDGGGGGGGGGTDPY